jgi:Uma2 family endonuclease
MAAPSFAGTLTVDEYLRSSYSPDCDYVDGCLEERNLGEYDHARLQTLLAIWFGQHEREWGIRTVVEQRVQVSTTRFRVPDICLIRRELPIEQIIHHPPLLCIEVLSPEDSMQRTRRRAADYFRMGVEHVWILDPAAREGLVCTASGWNQPDYGKFVIPGTGIYIDLAEIFAGLDEA